MLYLKAKKRFLDLIDTYCSHDTYMYYVNCFRHYNNFLSSRFNIDTYDINDVDRFLIFDYITYLRSLDIKNISVRTYVRGISSFYNYCYREELCYFKCEYIKLPRIDSEYKLPLTSKEFSSLLDYIYTNSSVVLVSRNNAIIYLMLSCGLRLQEVVNLKLSDVLDSSGCIVIRNSKYNKSRTIPLSSYGWCVIDWYIRNRGVCNHDYLFSQVNGNHIQKSTINQLFRKLKKVVPRVHPHLLRHTFATSYIMGGGSLEILRVLLGHSTYHVTQTYIAKAAELSLSRYPIFILEDMYFDFFNYNKKPAPAPEPVHIAETSGIRTPDNLIKRKGV